MSPPGRSTAVDPERRRDAERTKAEILKIATEEFAQRGYAGARVDEIAARTQTTKRMIYYYFGGKERLYIAVLESAYAEIRVAEQSLAVEHLDPVSAIRTLAEVTFDHHESHPDFVRLVSTENIHRAEHIAKSQALTNLTNPAIDLIATVLEAGREQGVFTADIDAVDLHMLISSFCFFRVANRHTFGTLFGRDLTDPARRDHYRQMLGDIVVGHLTSPGGAGGGTSGPTTAAR
ncbi:TetR/AcrR family transcriptional regulator [Actinomadura alba]|uniref:TetR family transcriptional regulator n=1 Tax=Actinomadura alba TaxID=406431 RepID=A0ABR7LYS1_9ACTN|nr:TetR/AcrR family transcriptional regulator [Actinomadura alba]MBC6469647.1 TetR family transcriptional regulator [Actinomadura alba]